MDKSNLEDEMTISITGSEAQKIIRLIESRVAAAEEDIKEFTTATRPWFHGANVLRNEVRELKETINKLEFFLGAYDIEDEDEGMLFDD